MSGNIGLNAARPVVAKAPAWSPSDAGLIAANADPATCNASGTLDGGAGWLTLVRVSMPAEYTVSTVKLIPRSPAAAGLVNAYAGVYNRNGQRLAVSADSSATLQNTGPQSIALTTTVTAAQGGSVLYVGIVVGTATTNPTFIRLIGSYPNAFLSPADYRAGYVSGGGLSALPSSVTMTGLNEAAVPWVGLA